MPARLKETLARLPLFWRLQIGGWLVHAVATLPLKIVPYAALEPALYSTAVLEPLGFLLTSGLRVAYKRLGLRTEKPVALTVGVIVCSGVAVAIEYAVSMVVGTRQWLDFPVVEPVIASGVSSFRAVQYLAWSILYFWIKNVLASRDRAMSLIRAETAAREAELRMLRAQINPHFLFNALNTVLAGIRPDQTALNEVVQGLSDYLRYSLAHRHAAFVPLGEEFDAALNYLAVEKARFRDGLVVDAHIDESARPLPAPGVFLQPLIENAVKHGYKTSPVPLRLRIDIRSHPTGGAVIEVTNSGRWIEPPAERREDDAAGHGLESVKRRLALMYPNAHQFDLSTDGDQVSIRIRLPAASPLAETA